MLNGKSPAAAVAAAAAERQFQQQMAQSVSYPSPTSTTSPTDHQNPMSMLGSAYGERPYENGFLPQQQEGMPQQEDMGPITISQRHGSNGGVKAFACTTCGKGFARRSDLARHGKASSQALVTYMLIVFAERIHSGDRPHVCPEKGCNKPFIQRSALTVHMRVHSGEKPHMCERCGKVRQSFYSLVYYS